MENARVCTGKGGACDGASLSHGNAVEEGGIRLHISASEPAAKHAKWQTSKIPEEYSGLNENKKQPFKCKAFPELPFSP